MRILISTWPTGFDSCEICAGQFEARCSVVAPLIFAPSHVIESGLTNVYTARERDQTD